MSHPNILAIRRPSLSLLLPEPFIGQSRLLDGVTRQ